MNKLIAILLTFILLVSSNIFTIGKHYCGGKVVERKMILGETHLDCGMSELNGSGCGDENHGLNLVKELCCVNRYQTFLAGINYISDTMKFNLNNEFIDTFYFTYLHISLLPNYANFSFSEYRPPPLIKEIPILFQIFLI